MSKVIIIGGGISGLTAAYRLLMRSKSQNFPLAVTLLEGSEKIGGSLSTIVEDGYWVEEGADSFITNKTFAKHLAIDLGLEDFLIETNQSRRRSLIAMKDRLVPLPDGFLMVAPTRIPAFLKTPLLSIGGKLRALFEYFLPAGNLKGRDESVTQFLTRRFGAELFEKISQPMVGGIYTGDCNRLSARSTLPRFVDLETKYGSVIRALLKEDSQAASTAAGARYAIFNSLTGGLQMLIDALCEAIGQDNIRLSSKVTGLSKNGPKWMVKLSDQSTIEADAVVIACAAKVAGEILSAVDQDLSLKLRTLNTASSVVINFLFDDEDIAKPIDGFGFVVPAVENKNILACAAISTKFVKRAPAGQTMLRVFIGGVLGKDLIDLDDHDLKLVALAELSIYLKLKGDPLKTWVRRWPNSMPQYEIGHQDLIGSIEKSVDMLEGLALCGNSYHGVGIPDCVSSGERAAEMTLQTLQKHDLLR
jgi:oxygen-dependent protoporphyrinogen oxidase